MIWRALKRQVILVAIEEVPSEPDRVEVILDSGADCTVLPLSYQAVGHKDSSGSKSILLDAQGNKIEGGESRVFVHFEIDTPDEDSVISFKDSVVLGNVQQPLFCLGKLMKRGWVLFCDEYYTWYMQKGEAWFPVHWSRNSLATHMRISRLEEMVVQGNGEDADQRLGEACAADQRLGTASAEGNQRLGDASVEGGTQTESFLASKAARMVVVIDEEMAEHAESPGWSLSTSMLPVHLAYNTSTTVDPSARFNPDEWPHRSTLIWKRGREYEVFECGEYWEPNSTLDLGAPARKLLTILTKGPGRCQI